MSTLFGGAETETSSTNTINRLPAKRIKLNAGNGMLQVRPYGKTIKVRSRLDPEIENLRTSAISATNDGLSRIEGMIGRLNDNSNPYVEARVRPTIQAAQDLVDSTSRDYGRRGVFGSMRQRSVNDAKIQGDNAVADQTALAESEVLNSLLQTEAAARGYTGDLRTFANDIANQEMAEMGLSQQLINLMYGGQFVTSTGGSSTTEEGDDVLGGLGKIATIAGGFF